MPPTVTAPGKGKGKVPARRPSSPPSTPTSSDATSSSDEHDVHSADVDDAEDSDDVSNEDMEQLLAKARVNMARMARQRRAAHTSTGAAADDDDQDVLLLEEDAPLVKAPPLDPGPSLPRPYIELGTSRTAPPRAVRNLEAERVLAAAGDAALEPAPAQPAYELTPSGARLTKAAKREMKRETAGPGWFGLPAPPAAERPRIYAEVEAMRLRNALDPKRFFRRDEGEGRGIKGLPKYIAMGKIVETTTAFGTASADNLTRAERKRTLVDELVDDAEARRYAKRKFNDLQATRAARGRGTLRKKSATRRGKW